MVGGDCGGGTATVEGEAVAAGRAVWRQARVAERPAAAGGEGMEASAAGVDA